jgi:hypothetical protein
MVSLLASAIASRDEEVAAQLGGGDVDVVDRIERSGPPLADQETLARDRQVDRPGDFAVELKWRLEQGLPSPRATTPMSPRMRSPPVACTTNHVSCSRTPVRAMAVTGPSSAFNCESFADTAMVAKEPITAIHDWGRQRGWTHLRLLSSSRSTYNRDYFGENEAGEQIPNLNVFRRVGDRIEHFYATELLFLQPRAGQHPRHVDLLWPLWGVLDLTPEGRGTDWLLSVRYAEER